MRHRMWNSVVACSIAVGLVGCGGLQPASIPEVSTPGNLETAPKPAPAPTPSAAPTPASTPPAAAAPASTPAPEVAPVSSSSLRTAIVDAQKRVDNSRRANPGAGRDLGWVHVYAGEGAANPIGLKLRRVDSDGKPKVKSNGTPDVEEHPVGVYDNWRSSGNPFAPKRAFAMWPEDAGIDQIELQLYKVNLTANAERADVHGENVWWFAEFPDEVKAAVARNVPIRIRYEDADGRNVFQSSQTFTEASTAIAICADRRMRWRIMPTMQRDGTIAHDNVLCDPTDPTVVPYIVRGKFHENEAVSP